MALPTARSRIAQLHVNRNPGVFKVVSRTFSLSIWQREPGSEENGHKPAPKRPYNSLLHVQTHTGVRNMAHGLHILRQIEKKFGAIESYLFPRESGTNEYHPAFFFRFRDPKSIKRLTSPFTHFDIPILALEDKPNHTIGINDIGYLISPDSREFSLVQGLELMRKETMDSVDPDSQEGAVSAGPDPPSTLKSRYAVRIAISGLVEYPQPFFSHKTINPREKPRIQQELSAWKSAYEVLGSSIKPSSQSETRPKIQTIEELLQENFNVPQDTLVLPQRKYIQKPIPHENNGSEPAEQPPQPTEYQLFKVHSRKSIRPVNGDPPPDSKPSAEVTSESDSSAEGVMSGSAAVTSSSMQSAPRISTKRERQLEQMRRAAASQVRSIAEKRRIEEEDAKRPKAESEVDHTPTVKQELSIWDRFLKR